MHATWSDTNSEESDSMASKDAKYDQNDFLAFVTSVEFVHDNECDSNNDDEFTNDWKTAFLNNLVVKYEKLIKNYLKDYDIL